MALGQKVEFGSLRDCCSPSPRLASEPWLGASHLRLSNFEEGEAGTFLNSILKTLRSAKDLSGAEGGWGFEERGHRLVLTPTPESRGSWARCLLGGRHAPGIGAGTAQLRSLPCFARPFPPLWFNCFFWPQGIPGKLIKLTTSKGTTTITQLKPTRAPEAGGGEHD